mgnify:CR=1 FL=1
MTATMSAGEGRSSAHLFPVLRVVDVDLGRAHPQDGALRKGGQAILQQLCDLQSRVGERNSTHVRLIQN